MPVQLTPPAWEGPFLAALAGTGNIAAAARTAGVNHNTAHKRKQRNATFAFAVERALEGFRADRAARRLAAEAAGDLQPRHCADGVKLARAGAGRINAAAERRFLEALVGGANVLRACKAGGFSLHAFQNRRRRLPAFAAAWDEAVAQGRDNLRSMLLHAAQAGLDPDLVQPAAGMPVPTIAEALAILKQLTPAEPAGAARTARGQPQPGFRTAEEREAEKREAYGRLEKILRQSGAMPLICPHCGQDAMERGAYGEGDADGGDEGTWGGGWPPAGEPSFADRPPIDGFER